MYSKRLAPAVHFSVDFRVLEGALNGQGNAQGDTAIAGINIHVARHGLDPYRAVPGVNLYPATDGLRVHRPIAGINVQVGVLGHAHFNLHPTPLAPTETPMAADARGDLDAVPVLPGIDVQSPVDLVTLVADSKLNLLGLASKDLHRAIVGLHTYIGAAGDGIRFAPILSADEGSRNRDG